MYRFSDLASDLALPGYFGIGLWVLDNVARVEFVQSRLGNVADLTTYIAILSVAWLFFVVIHGKRYRQKTADLLTALYNYGLNQVLHNNVDKETDFHHWLNRFGVWEADTLRTLHERHGTAQQRNDIANLGLFTIQAGLFHSDPERNRWKTMMSEKLQRLAKVTDEIAGRKR